MEAATWLDAALLLWLNSGVGVLPWLDQGACYLASDYLVPLLLSLLLLGLWFGARDAVARERQQRGVLAAMIGLGLANLTTLILNEYLVRPRPFVDHTITLLFYRPTDSSFPANPAVVGFALALGIWRANRRAGMLAYGLAALWGLSRVYGGVNYPLDLIAGALLGTLVSWLVIQVLARVEPIPTRALRLARWFYLA